MKVALVKQAFDVFGPWSSIHWDDTSPKDLFGVWPGKASLWEMTCLLRADWYIVSSSHRNAYHRDLLQKGAHIRDIIVKYTTDILEPQEVPLTEYDVVITLDPILNNIPRLHTLVAYYLNEHWQLLYKRSLRRPVGRYDLFLAHMMDAGDDLTTLPQAVSFPYMRAPEVVRSLFSFEKEDAVWVDWRTLIALSMADCWSEKAERAAKRLEGVLKVSVRYGGQLFSSGTVYGISDPPTWGDAANYLANLSRCKYYISVGRGGGAGQGLVDAASAGCICFGEQDKAYHRLICHPSCLCADMAELPAKFRSVIGNPGLHSEIIEWQDTMLRKHFMEEPLSLLQKAVEMKRSRTMRTH